MDKRITTILASVIIGAFSISFLLDAVVKEYDPPGIIYPLMTGLTGSVFAGPLLKRTNGKETQA